MDSETFRHFGHEIVDWVADYMDHVDGYRGTWRGPQSFPQEPAAGL